MSSRSSPPVATCATLSGVELVVLFAAVIAVGIVRPPSIVPAGLAFFWLLFHEDIPGERTTVTDVAWYAAMSVVVGAVFALAGAAGIVTGRALRRLR